MGVVRYIENYVSILRVYCHMHGQKTQAHATGQLDKDTYTQGFCASCLLQGFFHLPPPSTPRGPSHITEMSCLSDNAQAVDQSRFWSDKSIHWDAHRVGWAIAGGCTALVRIYLL